MASIKLCFLGLVVCAMLSAPGTWARKDPRSGNTIIVVRETIMNDGDVPKMEKNMQELSENSNNNVMLREVTSDGATTDNLKCVKPGGDCQYEECCSGICIDLLIYPPKLICVGPGL